jgi:trimeric autotransporter adhesin
MVYPTFERNKKITSFSPNKITQKAKTGSLFAIFTLIFTAMRKSLLLSIFLLPVFFATAQNVGIGVTTPTNKLHVAAANDPLRLEGLQSGVATDSVLTANSNGVVRRRTLSALLGSGAWQITGNAATSAVTNFLGTTDYISLAFRTNNQRAGFIDVDSLKRNNSFGNRAIAAIGVGTGNNAFGYVALSKATSGNNNVAFGDSASFNATTASDNVAIGADALQTIVTATGNVAIGARSLRNIVTSENVAIGSNAATNATAASNLLAIGANALQANQSIPTIMAIGNNALAQLTGGLENVAVGYNAGTSLTSGSYNVLLGHYAMSAITVANNNTMLGHNTGLNYTTVNSANNTFVGYQAGLSQTTGSGNTYIGASVDLPTVVSINNSTGLGQGVQITGSNQVRVGNTSVSSIGGQVGWTTFSDARIKNDIREDVHGLDFVMRLRPVSYQYDAQKQMRLMGSRQLVTGDANNTRYSGFLAQEVEAAAKAVQYDFSGVDKPANEQTPYGIRYAEMVVPLVKAVQELKAIIDQQQKEIEALKKALNK